MSKPEDIPQDVWDEASKADADCQRNSCKEESCNGFLCVRALRIAILAAKAEEREACARIAEDQDGGAIECEQIASAIRKRGEG